MTVYATVSELKAIPNIIDSSDDVTILSLLTAASSVIDGYCNRQEDGFLASSTATTKLFTGDGKNYLLVPEFVELTKVETRNSIGESWAELTYTDIVVFSGNVEHPNFNKKPYRFIMNISTFTESPISLTYGSLIPTVRITAKWGYSLTIPEQIKIATLTLASRWLKRGQSFWSDVMSSEAIGGVAFYRKIIDPDVEMMLKSARLIKPLYG